MMNTHERTRLAAVDDTIVIDDVGLAVLAGDTAGASLRWANPAFASLLGRQTDDLPGRWLGDLVDDRHLATALAEPDRGRA